MIRHLVVVLLAVVVALAVGILPARGQWVTRDHRWQPCGPWNWAMPRELPQLFREFNGIDFGHAHLAETLLRTQDPEKVERARLEVLEFIFSSPAVPPDEDQVAPTLTRLVWEVQRAFNWAHTLHRTTYDILASDRVADRGGAIRQAPADYLEVSRRRSRHTASTIMASSGASPNRRTSRRSSRSSTRRSGPITGSRPLSTMSSSWETRRASGS